MLWYQEVILGIQISTRWVFDSDHYWIGVVSESRDSWKLEVSFIIGNDCMAYERTIVRIINTNLYFFFLVTMRLLFHALSKVESTREVSFIGASEVPKSFAISFAF